MNNRVNLEAFRPQDLPSLRVGLAEAERNARERTEWANGNRDRQSCWAIDGFDDLAVRKAKQRALPRAEMFYVAPTMAELVGVAAQSMPEFSMREEDLPSRDGLIIYAEPPAGHLDTSDDPDCPCGKPHYTVWTGLLWTVTTSSEGLPFLILFPIFDRHASALGKGELVRPGTPRLSIATALTIPLLDREHPHNHGHVGGMEAVWMGTLRTACMLMGQPLATSSDVEPDAFAKQRLRRAKQRSSAIRVIELRRPKSSGESGDGESSYQHQWIVRGHWRNHWHPKREVHRPVWIAPHVKGPEGAPMIGGEKVYAWKR